MMEVMWPLGQDLYKKRDADDTGCMSTSEMRMAVEEAGETECFAHAFNIRIPDTHFMFSVEHFPTRNQPSVSVSFCVLFVYIYILWVGFSLSNPLHQIIVARYSESDLSIDFDNFVACLIRLEILFCELVCLITTVQTSSPQLSHIKKKITFPS